MAGVERAYRQLREGRGANLPRHRRHAPARRRKRPALTSSSSSASLRTKVSNDATVISRGIDTGLIEPWCAVNFGDSKLAPKRQYLLPNNEKEEKSSNYAKRNDAFYKALVDAKQAGLVLTPFYIQKLAKDYRVRVPELVSAPTAAPVTPIPK